MSEMKPSSAQYPQPTVLAHRGDSLRAPENTMPAFDLAVRTGTDGLETDIHWTRDGVIVVAHDPDVARVSDGHGFISEMTYTELRRLDFGYRFSRDGGKTFPYRGQGVQIPRLSELLCTFPGIGVNVDIKPKRPPSLRDLILEIHACRAVHRLMVASFHHRVLRIIRSMSPCIATSASPSETLRALLHVRLHLASDGNRVPYRAVQVPMEMYGIPLTTPGFIEWVHRHQATVHVWTVDNGKEMRRLFELGVDGIVTNRPELALMIRTEFTTGS